MMLSKQTQEHLEKIRDKVAGSKTKQTKWNSAELDTLEEVFAEVTKLSTGKIKSIDRTCPDCIEAAAGVVYNYITYHETKPLKAVKVIPAKTVETPEEMPQKQLTRKELEDLKFDKLWELARTAGYTGSKPSKAYLVNFLSQ